MDMDHGLWTNKTVDYGLWTKNSLTMDHGRKKINHAPRITKLMKKFILLTSILAAAVLALPACDTNVLDPTTHLEGIVVDETTRQPLDSVLVILYEDKDGPLMGSHPLQEMTTDKSGRFRFTFEWKEDPYTVRVTRRAYKYLRVEKSPLTGHQLVFDYQSLEGFSNRHSLTFDMQALGTLEVKLKNNAPASSSDTLTLTVNNVNRQNLYLGPQEFVGQVDKTLPEFSIAGNRYVQIRYSVSENGIKRDFKDSVFVRPFQKNVFTLSY
jgi:hypothetical protein